ncbi:MAG: pyridoxal phosphate-dependent aminotransferase [Hungatella sp.]
MTEFTNKKIDFAVLKERAYNRRWAEMPDGVIPLTAADSDFPVAPEITQAIIDYAQKGYFSYTPNLGLPSFKKSIAEALLKRKNEVVDPELILPVDSAARGMDIIAKTILKPGDEAIVFDPVDFLFHTAVKNAGASVVLYPMEIIDGRIDFSKLERYITPKTKMLGLCNPHNPLGLSFPKEDLDLMLQLSEKYGFYIMNDEIWSDIVYSDAKFNSIIELGGERKTISVFGFSKSFGIAGLRAGCLYCHDQDLFDKLVDVSGVLTTIGGISSLSQVAATACLDKCYYWVDEYVAHLQKNRDYAIARLSKMPHIKCRKPDATFVVFPDISELNMVSADFVKYVEEKFKLSIVPGGARFLGPGSEGHVRICLATSHEILEEGLNRLEAAIHSLS